MSDEGSASERPQAARSPDAGRHAAAAGRLGTAEGSGGGGLPSAERSASRPLVATLLGASAIALAPLLAVLAARWGGIDANATAFWRTALALPPLWFVLSWRGPSLRLPGCLLAALPGVFFAFDLWLWHASMAHIAAGLATLLSNLSAVCVPLLGWALLKQRYDRRLVVPTLVALLGSILVSQKPGAEVLSSLGVPGRNYALGNLLAGSTALAYSGYQLSAQVARRRHSALTVITLSTTAAAALLLLVATGRGEPLLPQGPDRARAWLALSCLALVSHVGGQGLIVWSLGRLPAFVVALLLLWQPVGATLLGGLVLGQRLSWIQAAGALVVLGGLALSIWLTRPAPRKPA